MSVTVYFTATDKRRNSTRKKALASFERVEQCRLKEPTSIISPSLMIASDDSILQYNYLYIYEFSRYYFIDDITSLNEGVWMIDASVDTLGTYHDVIEDTELYLLRCARNKNGYIMDRLYPMTSEVTSYRESVIQLSSFGKSLDEGYYIITTVGLNNNSNIAGQVIYQLTPAQFRTVINAMLGAYQNYNWGNLDDGLVNALYDPMSYIISCYWSPVHLTASQYSTTFNCGNWETSVSCEVIDGETQGAYIEYVSMSRRHPQSASRGFYCNLPPYSRYTLRLNVCQDIEIDMTQFDSAHNSLLIKTYVDPVTMQARVIGSPCSVGNNNAITEDTTKTLFNITVQYGVPISMSAVKNNMVNFIGDVVQENIISKIGGKLGDWLTNIANVGLETADAYITGGSVTNSGTNGSVIAHGMDKYLFCSFYTIAEDDPTNKGYPLCRISVPYSGYNLAERPSLEIEGALTSEINEMESLISTGFYME